MSVKEEAVKRAVKWLESAGASYHIKFESEEYGQPLGRDGSTPWKNKGVTEHVRSYMSDMNPGDIVTVPLDSFTAVSVQSTASWLAGSMYGKGSCITARKGDSIEVLRAE